MGAKKAAIDYVDDDRFMQCSQSYSSLAVLTAIIDNSPEFAAKLSNKFSSMLTCPDLKLPIKIFEALSKNADMTTLQDNISHVLLNDSAKVKKYAAYYSVKTPSITHADKEVLIKRMLSSDNPDDRMFAAVMTKHFNYWARSDVLARLCRAKNAKWHYDNSSGSDSIGEICQELSFRVSQNMRRSKKIQSFVNPF